MTTLDATVHAEAIKTAITAHLGGSQAYNSDEVPGTNGNDGTVPDRYAEVSVELEQPDPTGRRMGGQTAVRNWIATVTGVGRNVGEARWVLARVADALYERTLTVEGVTTEPLVLQESRDPEYDTDRYSGIAVYTYGH